MTSAERRVARYKRRVERREAKKRKLLDECGTLETIFTLENMYCSYKLCRRGVGWKASTQKYRVCALVNVVKTLNEIIAQTFHSMGFHEFDIMERGKLRHIQSVHISERVVQRCLCDYSLVPIFSRSFIYDNGACLKGKGIDFSINRFSHHLREHYRKFGNNGYILFFDFSKYFENIDHEKLKNIVKKYYNDERVINLINSLIDDFGGDRGIGLGSQISQICALMFPNRLDHYIKEVLHISGYGRYMDDGYLIHYDKKYLQKCLDKIFDICNELGIILNKNKTRIVKITRPLVFLKRKFILTKSGKIIIIPHRKSVVRMRRKLKKLRNLLDVGKIKMEDIDTSINAWIGSVKRFSSYKIQKSIMKLYSRLFPI